jgi:hypothetical protein
MKKDESDFYSKTLEKLGDKSNSMRLLKRLSMHKKRLKLSDVALYKLVNEIKSALLNVNKAFVNTMLAMK